MKTINRIITVIIAIFFYSFFKENVVLAQTVPVYEAPMPYTPSSPDSMKVYANVDVMPKFPENANKYIADSIRYPENAKETKIYGTVFISFIIEKDGSISTITVLRPVNPILDSEAKRVISTMPKWTPGKQNGVPVRVEYVIPVHFKSEAASVNSAKDSMNNTPLTTVIDTNKIYTKVQTEPRFIGNIRIYLYNNIKYPDSALMKNIQGVVLVNFVVERNGSISNIQVKHSPDKSLNAEAERVIANMPNWKPGRLNGVAVRTQYMIPVSFKLQ